MSSLDLIFIVGLGLCIGSFLNVLVCRLKTKESICFTRSHCPKCGIVLSWLELIPVISFVAQKGKCRHCGKKISWQYPITELITAVLFVAFFSRHQLALAFYYCFIASSLLVVFVYDLKYFIIPDKIIYPAVAVSFIFLLFVRRELLGVNLLSALIAAGFFLLLVLFSRGRAMGLGDVKLFFLMGLVLGWPKIFLALFFSFFLGAVIGLSLIVAGKKKLKSEIPFGPFLAGSTLLALLYGQQILDWYSGLFF